MLRHWSLVILGLLFSLCVQGRELQAVGTTFTGIFEQDQKGNFFGLGVDLVRTLCGLQGDTVKFKIEPWTRAQETVANSAGDILIGPYLTSEREKRFVFMDQPFYEDNMVFYVNAGSDRRWDGSYTSLIGKRIVTIRGWAYGGQFDRELPNLNVEVTSTIEGAMLMPAANRMDYLAVNERNAYRESIKPDIRPAVAKIAPPIGVQYGYIAFPRDPRHMELLAKYNMAFKKLVNSGQFAAMATKYAGLVKIPPKDKTKFK
jgi:polar amino acid transport system substrate-binding protein